MMFFSIDFLGFWPRFGKVSASKSAALLAAPGVLNPTAFLLVKHTAFAFLGGAERRSRQAKILACWGHVGTFFALGRLFFALGWFLSASCTFLARVGRFFRALDRSGLDFGWSEASFGALKATFEDVFGPSQARITEMLLMQQNHSFCDVL